MNIAIIHYDEIGLRGGNRQFFENLLLDNIKKKLGDMCVKVRKETGQFAIEFKGSMDDVKDVLIRIPGLAYFSFAVECKLDHDEIKKTVLELVKDREFTTFKIDTKRRIKHEAFNSQKMNEDLGEAVIDTYGKKAKMTDMDLRVKVEITKNAYVSVEDIKGVGGIPTKDNQRVVALLSGGFDSPVAAYMMMKRGCTVVMVHFQNSNQMKDSVQDKVEKLAKQLSKYQISTRLYVVPFADLQKEIIMKVKAETRMLVYRRFMVKIASVIAKNEKARMLVVGDSLSQVASQTLQNIDAVYSDSPRHILSPLIGMHKNEIIDISRKIGTYLISELPYGDCCSYFLPKHPELRSHVSELRLIEEGMDVDKLVNDAVEKVKAINL